MKNRNLAALVIVIAAISLHGEMITFDDVMMKITEPYFQMQKNLSSDVAKGNLELTEQMMPLIMELKKSEVPEEHKEHYMSIPVNLEKALMMLRSAKDIAAQREAFRELSKPMAMWASMAKPAGVYVAYCSMSPGSWLQQDEDIRNPYYGSQMLKCGEIISSAEESTEMKMKKEKHGMHHK
ncbi:DUF3347 domain-containing protein [Candidatus Cloacimonadota bacterium]